MRIELLRDADGRPAAVRVRTDERRGVRGAIVAAWGRLPAAPRPLARVGQAAGAGCRAAVRGVCSVIPAFEFRRGPDGRPTAIVLRLGIMPPAVVTEPLAAGAYQEEGRPAVAPAVARQPLRPRVATAMRSLRDGAVGLIPRITFRRGEPADPAGFATDAPWTIEPVRPGLTAVMAEMWQYRRLFSFFAVSSVKYLYEGTGLGMFWLFGRPLLPILIGTFIFGRLLGAGSDGLPYFLFYLAGNSIWMLFDRALLWSTRSLDMQRGVIQKMYFPRLIVPISGVAPSLAYFGIYATLLILTGFYYLMVDGHWYLSRGPGWLIAFGMACGAIVMAISIGLFTSVWQAKYRDVRWGLRYVLGFWMYVTPVIYPMSQVPEKIHWVIYLNPMAAIVETFKWGLLGVGTLPVVPLICALTIIPIMLAAGTVYFMRSEAASIDQM